jgi:hypothetical protein
VKAAAGGTPVDNPVGQLEAAAAGAELDELELELSEDELDFSDDEDDELLDSELPLEPLDEPDELVAALLVVSRLSLR